MPFYPDAANGVQVINVLLVISVRLARLVTWGAIAAAHFALALGLFAVGWWFAITPGAIETFWAQSWLSKTFGILQSAGLSVVGVAAAYWWLMRKLHHYLHGDAFFYYLTGLPRS